MDSVEVAVIPILLGEGVPLLAEPEMRTRLELTKHEVHEKTGTISLEYGVK